MGLEQMVNKYIVTSAQYGASVNKNFLAGLETYSKQNNAEILVLPMRGIDIEEDTLARELQPYKTVEKELNINKNIRIKNYNVRPNQIEPTTGLIRFAQGDRTTIFPSPKQRMRVVPNSNVDLPKVLMSTGAVTNPYYDKKHKINEVAREDHKYGAIVVEKVNGTHYHYRQIDALKNGKFYDLGVLYNGKEKPVFKGAEALVLGDLHSMVIDKKVHEANLEQIKELQPQYVILHDLFDGASINHWEEGKEYTKVQTYHTLGLSLKKELEITGTILSDYAAVSPNVVVVKSNHDERIDRWLEESRYVKEPQNNILGHELFLAKHEGHDPLQYGLESLGYGFSNVTYLSRDEDFKVRGYQLGNHGDHGANGGKGSMRSIEFANGKSITAHSHSPQILRDTYVVGTSTPLKLPYNKGFSSWMNTNAVLYDIGKVQLINTVRGRWKL